MVLLRDFCYSWMTTVAW